MHLKPMSQNTNSSIQENILRTVQGIQAGKTLSYKEVAILSGYPSHARFVGYLMSKNYDPKIPCHRVIKSNNEVGEYNRGVTQKIAMLRTEGVQVVSMPNGVYVVQ